MEVHSRLLDSIRNFPLSPSAVRGPSHLSAGPVVHLVWEPGGLERQQDGLEALRLRVDRSDHALPLPRLLDRTKVQGSVEEFSQTFWSDQRGSCPVSFIFTRLERS